MFQPDVAAVLLILLALAPVGYFLTADQSEARDPLWARVLVGLCVGGILSAIFVPPYPPGGAPMPVAIVVISTLLTVLSGHKGVLLALLVMCHLGLCAMALWIRVPPTGSPWSDRPLDKMRMTLPPRLLTVRHALSHWPEDRPLPSGWLDEVIPRLGNGYGHFTIVERSPAWHSWVTGLYFDRRVAYGIWYPGGKLAEAIPKIEGRRRALADADRGP